MSLPPLDSSLHDPYQLVTLPVGRPETQQAVDQLQLFARRDATRHSTGRKLSIATREQCGELHATETLRWLQLLGGQCAQQLGLFMRQEKAARAKFRNQFRAAKSGAAQYGGFVGGLASVELKPPPSQWHLTFGRLDPSLRGKEGHLAGVGRLTPEVCFGGPLWKNKVNFAESFLYELMKPDVRGLAWPNDEKKIQGFNSITQFQFFISPTHYASFAVNLFPRRDEWANLNALIPRPSTVDWGQKGFSLRGSDVEQFGSGSTLDTFVKFMSIDTYSHGHGPEPMLLTPTGVGGDYSNSWARTSRQEQAESIFSFPARKWLGRHQFQIGAEVIHRGFTGFSQSHPVLILRNDGSAAERIDFSGSGDLAARDTTVTVFGQDHWVPSQRLAVTLGLRLFDQTDGAAADFAPRLGFVYALDRSERTVLRGGFGVFYDRTPLLAADFDQNPARVVTPLGRNGSRSGPSVAYRNICTRMSSGTLQSAPGCSELGSTPHNLTWRFELSHRFTRRLTATMSGLYSHTRRLFVVDSVLQPNGGLLRLSNVGSSLYREFEASLNYAVGENAGLSLSYVRSGARGDLNTTDGLFVPFEAPVIQPDAYAALPSDIPNRLTGFGLFKLPWELRLSPSVVLSSGFPYSDIDTLHDYVGVPDSRRYPNFFSLSWRVYRDFHLPFRILRHRKFRFGVYSINTTDRQDPTAVYNNITSPYFGRFTGFDKRIDGLVIESAD
jgi:TonB dependent receptor-like, beta-barrel